MKGRAFRLQQVTFIFAECIRCDDLRLFHMTQGQSRLADRRACARDRSASCRVRVCFFFSSAFSGTGRFFRRITRVRFFSSRTTVSRQVSAICCNGHESSRMKRWVTVLRQQGQRPSVESTGGGNRASPLNTVSGCGSGKKPSFPDRGDEWRGLFHTLFSLYTG